MSELDSSEVETETALDDEKASKISSTPTGGWQDLSGDWANIGLLLLLYTLQGVPMGLASSIPLLLQEKGATYGQQGLFSLVSWPFSLKILWAPIVDSWYNERFGRRKSWLVPVQLLCGLTMIAGGTAVNRMLGDGSEPPAVAELTMCFFMLHLLMATQDIAVDGWALTMLARRNVGWASTCNSIGQTLGYVVSFIIFMALNNADFCNTYLRASLGYAVAEQGMVTLGGFTAMWGCVFLVTTMLVWAFKSEKRAGEITMSQESTELLEEVNLDVRGAYSAMLQVVRLQPVGRLALVLLTSRVAFAAADSVTGLKLQEHGIAKETLAMIGVGVTPIALVLPALIARYTSGPQPLQPFMAAVPYRLLMNLAFSATVWFVAHSASSAAARDSEVGGGGKPEISALNWAVILAAFGVQQVVMNVMFVSQMAFFAKVSEPRIGGTYMTLLNTIANLGAKWPSTLVFPLIDVAGVGGADGYHVTNLACTILGVAWYFGVRTVVKELSAVPSHKWWTQPRTKGEEMQALV